MKGEEEEPENYKSYVGDKYWLAFAAEVISETNSTITRQADRLATTAAWLWTVYLAFLALRPQACSSIDVIASLPCVTLIVAYVIATVAAGPAFGNFDPRSPDDVRRSFNSSVRCRRNLLGLAQVVVVLSAILIVFGILR